MAPVHIFEISLVKYFGKTALERMSSCPLCPADNSFFPAPQLLELKPQLGSRCSPTCGCSLGRWGLHILSIECRGKSESLGNKPCINATNGMSHHKRRGQSDMPVSSPALAK